MPMDSQRDTRESTEFNDRAADMESRTDDTHELLHKDERDVEAHRIPLNPTTTATPLEYTVSMSKKLTYLALYFLLNLSVTLSNKALLRIVRVGKKVPNSHCD